MITHVALGTLDRSTLTSDKELYVNTGLSTDLTQGASYAFSMSHEPDLAFCPTYQLRVWIDWNVNGVFTDPGETVVSQDNYSPTTLDATIDVPPGASIGATRMRVAMKMEVACGHDPILPCPEPEPFGWHGEIEDYTINVVPGGGGCDPVPVTLVHATKSSIADVELTWAADPNFASYSSYAVVSQDPTLIPMANGAGELALPSEIENVCRAQTAPCVDPGRVVSAPDLVFYQLVGVCQSGEEGPNE